MAIPARFRSPGCIVLDIEGTTTSLRFIKDTLFPYIKRSLYKFLKERWQTEEVSATLTRLYRQEMRDKGEGLQPPKILKPHEIDNVDSVVSSIVANVLWQMETKRHNTALKQLQILVWIYGYECGELKGHVYDDVAPAFKKWKSYGIRLFVYSTGMAVAQQLLFANSTQGNLLNLVENYFDLLIGPKTSAASYKKLSSQYIMAQASDLLFITDAYEEGKAARDAGLQVALVQRPENKQLPQQANQEFSIVSSLLAIEFEGPVPRY